MPDVTLTITIPSDHVAKVQEGFLHQRPKDPEAGLTDKEHIQDVLVDYLKRVTKAGLRDIHEATADLSSADEIV
jgi:hypothetical protein